MSNRFEFEFERVLAKYKQMQFQNRVDLNSKISHLEEITFTQLGELYRKVDKSENFVQDDIVDLSNQILKKYKEEKEKYLKEYFEKDKATTERLKKEVEELNERLEK